MSQTEKLLARIDMKIRESEKRRALLRRQLLGEARP